MSINRSVETLIFHNPFIDLYGDTHCDIMVKLYSTCNYVDLEGDIHYRIAATTPIFRGPYLCSTSKNIDPCGPLVFFSVLCSQNFNLPWTICILHVKTLVLRGPFVFYHSNRGKTLIPVDHLYF